jgi:hypothetical protein
VFWSRRRGDRTETDGQVVPRGFDVLARAVLINDRDRMISAARLIAGQRAAEGGSWRSFRADLERTWQALGRVRPPRIVVKTAESAWATTATS